MYRTGHTLPSDPCDGYWTRMQGKAISYGQGMWTKDAVATVKRVSSELTKAGFPVIMVNREKDKDAAFIVLLIADLTTFHPNHLPRYIRECGGWTVVADDNARAVLGIARDMAPPPVAQSSLPPGGPGIL